MRITNNFMYNTISEVVGEDVIPIVEYLKNRKNISEFQIAEKTDLEINITRNVLYRLHSHNLVRYNRKKDRQKGWYITYWTFNARRIKELAEQLRKKKLDRFKERLEKEETHAGNFYLCSKTCVRLNFDAACDFNFKCPECGEILNPQDNTKTIEHLRTQIAELESEQKLSKQKVKRKAG
ncbi:hypothetical protein HYW21_07625 [Candidatus Woesearchaeota archaeon]|nr:hypothetical protein [Candidatus Woesearchaeota archaeon]